MYFIFCVHFLLSIIIEVYKSSRQEMMECIDDFYNYEIPYPGSEKVINYDLSI